MEGGVHQEIASLIVYMGEIGLYSTVVGFAVMLLMPERSGHVIGARLALTGGVAMGYEVVLSHVV